MSDSTQVSGSPLPPPTLSAPSVLIAVEPPPKPRHGKFIAVLAVTVLLIGGFIAYLSTAGPSDDEYSLEAALASQQVGVSVEYETTLSMGFVGDIAMGGSFDAATNRMAMTLNMPSFGGPPMSMLLDLENGVAYVDTEGLSADDLGFEPPTRWVSMSTGDLAKAGTMGATGSPTEMVDPLRNAENITDLGMDEYRGEEVRHYRVTISLEQLVEANPTLGTQLETLGGELDSVDYDVYVTKDNQLRAMSFTVDVMGQMIAMEFVITKYGDIEPIELPDPADVTDESDLGL